MKNITVIKIGSNSLLDDNHNINKEFLKRIVSLIKGLQSRGQKPLLVLSGAVATGKSDVDDFTSHQARAARGQLIISSYMYQLGEQGKVKFAQFLISRQDIIQRDRYITLQKTFQECLAAGVVPLINENDTTSAFNTHDFVDNDQIAAIVGVVAGASNIFLFTNVAGVFRLAPDDKNTNQTPIARITDVNKELMSLHVGKKSLAGRGGMESKLRSARLASFLGLTTYILDGRILEHALEIFDGDDCRGTMCLPWPHPISLSERSQRIIVSHTSSASIKVDDGAVRALRQRKSLLAVGVVQVYGNFEVQDSVEIIDQKNQPIALGVSALSSSGLNKMIVIKEKPFNTEVIHADNLILFPL